MRIADLIWLPGVIFLLAVAATGAIRVFTLKTGLLDLPTARSSHVAPTPRGGGLAVALVFLLTVLCMGVTGHLSKATLVVLLAGGGSIAAIGFVDDRRSLPASWRFGVHATAAFLVLSQLGHVPWFTLDMFGISTVWLERLLVLVGVVWATNLFNFMDGIDGIAGSEATFFAISAAWLNWMLGGGLSETLLWLSVAASCLGFLIWNWPPAKIFMGDVGSSFLGFVLVALALLTSKSVRMSIEPWIILGGVFIVDSSVTLIRRMLRGDRWFEAHRLHAYQHLARRWGRHLPVTLLVTGVNILWLLPWAFFAALRPEFGMVSLVASLFPLIVLAILAGAGRVEREG